MKEVILNLGASLARFARDALAFALAFFAGRKSAKDEIEHKQTERELDKQEQITDRTSRLGDPDDVELDRLRDRYRHDPEQDRS